MFESMEITETIYEGFVEPYSKKLTIKYASSDGHSRKKKGESASSKIYSKIGRRSGRHNKRYVDFFRDRLQLT